jgi:hypothetical protein
MTYGLKYISSDKDTQFDSTLAQHAIETESIAMPETWQQAGIYKCVISEMMLQCTQGGLDLELIFWRSASANSSDMDLAKIITRISLTEGTDGATQIGAANQYYYKNPLGQSIEYVDEDHSGQIHVSLVNRDATTKNTAAVGTIQMTAGTGGQFTMITIGGVEVLSAPVAFNGSINQTVADLETNLDAYTGTSGWTSDATTDTLTITSIALGSVNNDLEIVATVTSDIATTDVDPSGGLGDIVLTLGCTPTFF